MGRTTIQTPEIIETIVDGISEGITLRQLCRDLGISKSVAYNWFEADPVLSGRIARARVLGHEQIAEECLAIAEDGRRDYEPNPDGTHSVNSDHIQRAKLRIDTRLKLLAKWDSGRYGERIQQQHTSPDGSMSPPANIVVKFVGD